MKNAAFPIIALLGVFLVPLAQGQGERNHPPPAAWPIGSPEQSFCYCTIKTTSQNVGWVQGDCEHYCPAGNSENWTCKPTNGSIQVKDWKTQRDLCICHIENEGHGHRNFQNIQGRACADRKPCPGPGYDGRYMSGAICKKA